MPPSPPAPRGAGDRVALAVATLAGAGYAPVAPGTVGSAVTAALLGLMQLPRPGLAALFVAVACLGTWAAGRAERLLGEKDARPIVIDEVAGMTLAALAVPPAPGPLAAAFLLFRFFDVAKPFPARRSERLAGGVGVMVDDLVAALYALALLGLGRAVLGWP